MKWTLENLPVNLSDLRPDIREKAIEIANHLVKSESYDPEEALKHAIQLAEEWFYESEG